MVVYAMKNLLKEKLDNGEAVTGTFVGLGHPDVTEVLSRMGFDWLLIDGERADAVSLAVKRLLHDPACAQRMGQAAYDRVREEFTYERAARRLGEIAQGCASQPPG